MRLHRFKIREESGGLAINFLPHRSTSRNLYSDSHLFSPVARLLFVAVLLFLWLQLLVVTSFVRSGQFGYVLRAKGKGSGIPPSSQLFAPLVEYLADHTALT